MSVAGQNVYPVEKMCITSDALSCAISGSHVNIWWFMRLTVTQLTRSKLLVHACDATFTARRCACERKVNSGKARGI